MSKEYPQDPVAEKLRAELSEHEPQVLGEQNQSPHDSKMGGEVLQNSAEISDEQRRKMGKAALVKPPRGVIS